MPVNRFTEITVNKFSSRISYESFSFFTLIFQRTICNCKMTNRISKIVILFSIIFSNAIFINLSVREAVASEFCRTLPVPIDLSYVMDERTENWISTFKFQLIDRIRQILPNGGFYAMNHFIGTEHGGTHIDAPYHFNEAGIKVSEIPLTNLITAGITIDVSDLAKDNPDFELNSTHLNDWVTKNGPVPKNSVLLVNFGWARRYGNRTAYYGNTNPPYSFPGISEDAAQWIAGCSENIRGVGVDTPSTDSGKSQLFPAHKIFAASSIYGLENVALNNTNLPATGFQLIIMPFKIGGGTGAPCRIVAF